MRNVVFVTPSASQSFEDVHAAAGCDSHAGDGGTAVRHPDTEVVIAATRTITKTIAIEYG